MANPYRGEVSLDLGTRTLTLRPTMEAIIEWEEATAKGTLEMAIAGSERRLRTLDMVEVVMAAAKAGGTPIDRAEIGHFIRDRGINALVLPAISLLGNAFSGGAKDADDEPGAGEDDAPLAMGGGTGET